MNSDVKISVLCPVYNEANYIENILRFFFQSAIREKELFIIDGGSADGTIQIVEKWAKRYDSIHLVHNSKKYVPYALNLGLKKSTGKIIIRLDAHTVYDKNYFNKILETFEKTGADIVGGPMRARGKTNLQKAVAYCTSTKFGVGDSQFHNENFEGYVDSVYLGSWRREIFDEVGYFDERFKRNQDDEFHYRAKSFGKKIYLNPEIKSEYFPRDSFRKLFIQYFEYGIYKPLVLKKVKSGIRMRHLIPAFFVLYIFSIPVLFSLVSSLAFLPLVVYSALAILFSMKNKGDGIQKLYSIIIYPWIHIAYGSGFIAGIFKN